MRLTDADMLAQHTAAQVQVRDQATTSIGSAGGLGLPLAGVMDLQRRNSIH